MDLTGIMANQIIQTDLENQLRQERYKQQKLEQDLRIKEEREAEERIGAIRFSVVKNKMEKSPLRGILETLARELNSFNPDFALLKARIVEMVRQNPHSEIADNPNFFVDKPYIYNGGNGDSYSIAFFTSDEQGIQYNKIFSVTYSEGICHFSFNMSLYQYDRSFVLYKTDPESLARNIINYIMTE